MNSNINKRQWNITHVQKKRIYRSVNIFAIEPKSSKESRL